MGVDAKITGRTKKKSLAFLPIGTGREESLAGGIKLGLGRMAAKVGELLAESLGGVGKIGVSGSNNRLHIGIENVLLQRGILIGDCVFGLAGTHRSNNGHGSKQNGCTKESFFYHNSDIICCICLVYLIVYRSAIS